MKSRCGTRGRVRTPAPLSTSSSDAFSSATRVGAWSTKVTSIRCASRVATFTKPRRRSLLWRFSTRCMETRAPPRGLSGPSVSARRTASIEVLPAVKTTRPLTLMRARFSTAAASGAKRSWARRITMIRINSSGKGWVSRWDRSPASRWATVRPARRAKRVARSVEGVSP